MIPQPDLNCTVSVVVIFSQHGVALFDIILIKMFLDRPLTGAVPVAKHRFQHIPFTLTHIMPDNDLRGILKQALTILFSNGIRTYIKSVDRHIGRYFSEGKEIEQGDISKRVYGILRIGMLIDERDDFFKDSCRFRI